MGVVSRPRWIPAAAYVSIFVILAVGLVIVLPKGNEIQAAPQMPEIVEVSAEARECLGDILGTVQSGVFLDLHGTAASGDGDLGPRLVGGEVDRLTGESLLTGFCGDGTTLGESPATLSVVVTDGVGFEGTLDVDNVVVDVVLTEADATSLGSAETEELAGGELISRRAGNRRQRGRG